MSNLSRDEIEQTLGETENSMVTWVTASNKVRYLVGRNRSRNFYALMMLLSLGCERLRGG